MKMLKLFKITIIWLLIPFLPFLSCLLNGQLEKHSTDETMIKYVTKRDANMKKIPEALAYWIAAEKPSVAVNDFKNAISSNMSSSFLIDNTINECYSFEHIENILTFINGLPRYEYCVRAYDKLYEKMRANGHEKTAKMILLYDAVMIKLADQDYSDLKSKFRTSYDYVINLSATLMRNSPCNRIHNLAGKNYEIRSYQEDLVKAAYANNTNYAEKILECIQSMPNIEDSITMYPVLYAEMKRNDDLDTPDLMTLAFNIKELMKMPSYSNVNEYYKYKITELKNSLPIAVREITSEHDYCYLKNIYQDEYLLASEFYKWDEKRRNVFTWRDRTKDDRMRFQLIANRTNIFAIKNVQFNEYMYAASWFLFDKDRRRVFTWIPGGYDEMGEWRLEPKKNGNVFKIRNVYHNEYLYAADYSPYDKNRRRVFTWIPGISDEDVFLWNIKCTMAPKRT